jgi:SAM-dependent methyltransferase
MQTIISYSHQDRVLLEATILPVLEKLGVKVWMDDHIPTGETWFDWFSKKIDQVDVLTILFTQSYSESAACDEERKWMFNARLKTRSKRLAVVWRNGELPATLETTQAIDVRSSLSKLEQKLGELFPSGPSDIRPPEKSAPLPAIYHPRDLPILAQANFDRLAPDYMKRLNAESMQGRNAVRLLRRYLRCKTEQFWTRPQSMLDVGCGTGLVAYLIRNNSDFQILQGWLAVRAGSDYAQGMLELARKFEPGYTHCFACDVKDLSPDRLQQEIGSRNVGLVLANNVFHWLFTHEAIETAFKACRSVMADGGVMAASIAGEGTASLFLNAYQKVLTAQIVEDDERRKWSAHLSNPIGLQRLDGLVDTARLVGLNVVDAQLVYEPLRYDCTDRYVKDARAYGEDVFMAPLGRYDHQARERVWKAIMETFRTDHESKFQRAEYVHDQFMIYLILRRVD